ncbi:hypothetical protein [Rhodococcus sp. YH1]|uniref:hypothetical protein n=1 Tax=Rhodococcus sp. YH1 TaxID=89066 RepID=UPI001386D6E1|nr:hypothetical protein [Rhodococcus sp. YH1]
MRCGNTRQCRSDETLTPAERDDVDFLCDDHRWRTAVVTAVSAAAARRATVPALALKLLQLLPDVEAAVVLKTLAWHSRSAANDIGDLCSLMTIVHEHKPRLPG